MANNRIAYGLAKQYGIDTTGMSPKQVWDALKEKGINQEIFSNDKISEYNDLSVEDLKERQTIDLSKKKVSLSKSEWALWYKAISEIEKLGYYADTMPNGDKIIILETGTSSKVVITGGSYENPQAKNIYSFDNLDEMIKAIERIKKL